eukprot:427295-Amorphochlora_amoeboformis.AAC.2
MREQRSCTMLKQRSCTMRWIYFVKFASDPPGRIGFGQSFVLSSKMSSIQALMSKSLLLSDLTFPLPEPIPSKRPTPILPPPTTPESIPYPPPDCFAGSIRASLIRPRVRVPVASLPEVTSSCMPRSNP